MNSVFFSTQWLVWVPVSQSSPLQCPKFRSAWPNNKPSNLRPNSHYIQGIIRPTSIYPRYSFHFLCLVSIAHGQLSSRRTMDFIDLSTLFFGLVRFTDIFSLTYYTSRFITTTTLISLFRSRDMDSAPCLMDQAYSDTAVFSSTFTFFIVSYNTDKRTISDNGSCLSIVYICHYSFLWTLNGLFLRGLRYT